MVNSESTVDLLAARIRLSAPQARSFLVTAPRGSGAVKAVASDLAEALRRVVGDVESIDFAAGSNSAPANADLASRLRTGDVESARAALRAREGYLIVAAEGLLERGPALILAAATDGVLLVIRRGKTARADLKLAQRQIAEVGGRLLVAAYLT